jgi:hypothetical protein
MQVDEERQVRTSPRDGRRAPADGPSQIVHPAEALRGVE